MKRIRRALLVIVITSLIALPIEVALCRATGSTSAFLPAVAEGANLVALVNQSGLGPDVLNFLFFDDPEQALGSIAVMGLEPDEKIGGISFDIKASKIIGVTNIGNVVLVDPQTGIATKIASISPNLARGKLALDFDPDTRRLLIMSESGIFIEIDLSRTPPLVIIDSQPTYAADDVNAGKTPKIAGLASNKITEPNSSNIFVIDSANDTLAVIDGFKLKTVGALGVNTTSGVGITAALGSPFAFASLLLEGEEKSRLYIISLISGLAVEMGSIGVGGPVRGLALLLDNKNTDVISCDVNPSHKDNPVGTSHKIKVTVKKNGVPVQNAFVLVGILVGPNAGAGGHGRSRDNPATQEKEGDFDFAYTSNGRVGVDLILVGVIADGKIEFCKATKRWFLDPNNPPDIPGNPGLLTITEVIVSKKKVIVKGCCFQNGDVIVINDKAQKTKNDSDDPEIVLIARKGGKKLEACENNFKNRVFVRRAALGQPVQDTEAFATCP